MTLNRRGPKGPASRRKLRLDECPGADVNCKGEKRKKLRVDAVRDEHIMAVAERNAFKMLQRHNAVILAVLRDEGHPVGINSGDEATWKCRDADGPRQHKVGNHGAAGSDEADRIRESGKQCSRSSSDRMGRRIRMCSGPRLRPRLRAARRGEGKEMRAAGWRKPLLALLSCR